VRTESADSHASLGRRSGRRLFRLPTASAATNGQATQGAGAGSEVVPARKWITAALMLVMMLASLEATVTSTAMPTIIGDLHGLEHYSWVASIYLLASTVVMPLYGRLADVLGRKRVMLFAIGVFAAGSILAAFSHNMGQLILFRGMQGLGAGGIMPLVLTILGDIFTLEERARIQGIFSAVWGTSALAGPALGAFLVKTLGWPSVFWVNLPAGMLGLLILVFKYHDRQKPHSTDLDLFGVVSLAIGSTALLGTVSLLAGVQISLGVPAILFVVALVMLIAFFQHERRTANPIMSPELMMRRAIGPSMILSVLLGLGVFAVDTYVPLYVQGGRGGDASAAAATVTPVMLAWAISSIFAAPMVVRLGFRATSLIGATFVLVGLTGLLVGAWAGAPLIVLTVALFLTGCGFGPSSMASLFSAQDAVGWQQRGNITSGITFFRNFGGAMGVGTLGTLFNVLTASELRRDLAGKFPTADLLNPDRLASLQRSHPELLAAARGTIAHGLLWVFVAMVLAAIAQLAMAGLLRADRHNEPVSTADALASVE
jgi:MFS family permease